MARWRCYMALREELMNRFASLGEIPSEAIMQEVIRQMRWARHSYRFSSPEARDWDWPPDTTADIESIAPGDWFDGPLGTNPKKEE